MGLSEQLPPSPPPPSLGARSSAEGRPGHSRSSWSSREAGASLSQLPPPLSQSSVRPAAVSACSPGTVTTSGFSSHLFSQNLPSRRLRASRRRAADASTRRPESGPALGGGGPRLRTGRARQSAGNCSVQTHLRLAVASCCCLFVFPEPAGEKLVTSSACGVTRLLLLLLG